MIRKSSIMQKALFPILKTWESQPMNVGSHKDTKAIDFGVLNPYKDTKLTAPFDGKVVYVDSQACGGGIAFESLEKVKFANGYEDYMTLWTGHDNKPPKLDTIFKQGEYYSDMGTAGGVDIHCHLEVQKGKFKKPTKITSVGSYKLEDTIEPYNALFLREDTFIKKTKYNWKREGDIILINDVKRNEILPQIKVIVSELRIRSEPNTDADILGFAKKYGIYNDLEVYKDSKYIWHKIADNQWLADNGNWLQVLPVTDYKTLYETEVKKNEKINEYLNKIKVIINKK